MAAAEQEVKIGGLLHHPFIYSFFKKTFMDYPSPVQDAKKRVTK